MRSPERKLSILLAIALGGAGASVPISVRLISDALKPKSLAQASEIIPATATSIAPTKTATLKAEFTVTPIATTSPAAEPTATATAEPTREPTKIPPTPTEEPIDRYPDEVKRGELPKQLKPFDSPEQATQASTEQGKPIIPVIFKDPDSVEMKKVSGSISSAYKITSNAQVMFVSSVECDVVDEETYDKILKSGKHPRFLIMVRTDQDFKKLPSPPSGYVLRRTIRYVEFFDDNPNISRKEVVTTFPVNSDLELFKKPGDKAKLLETVMVFGGSPPDPKDLSDPDPANTFRMSVSVFDNKGNYSSNASFESFAQIENRTGYLPLASSK